jgi:hypothetical protein
MNIIPKPSRNIGPSVAAASATLAACTMLASSLFHEVDSPRASLGATSTPMIVQRSEGPPSSVLFPPPAPRDRLNGVVTILAPVGDGWS